MDIVDLELPLPYLVPVAEAANDDSPADGLRLIG